MNGSSVLPIPCTPVMFQLIPQVNTLTTSRKFSRASYLYFIKGCHNQEQGHHNSMCKLLWACGRRTGVPGGKPSKYTRDQLRKLNSHEIHYNTRLCFGGSFHNTLTAFITRKTLTIRA